MKRADRERCPSWPLAAGREKDWSFVKTLLQHTLVNSNTLQERIAHLPLPSEAKMRLADWVFKNSPS